LENEKIKATNSNDKMTIAELINDPFISLRLAGREDLELKKNLLFFTTFYSGQVLIAS